MTGSTPAGSPVSGPWPFLPISGIPFPGLRPFEVSDSYLFFGRTEQIDGLLDRLQKTRFLAIVGESGCGKSSLVRAGLIPGLYAGDLPEDEVTPQWRIALLRPGSDPIRNLARALMTLGTEPVNPPGIEAVCSELKRKST